MTNWAPRMMVEGELPALARLWLTAWRDGHAEHVDPALYRLRTEASFAERLAALQSKIKSRTT